MKAIVQRVFKASVEVDNKIVGSIKKGYCVYIGFNVDDNEKNVEYVIKKIAGLRLFEDENQKINLPLQSVNGEILVISNFSLYGNCSDGFRPSFINAKNGEDAHLLYDYALQLLHKQLPNKIQSGIFGAEMTVNTSVDGPLNIIIEK